VMEVVKEDTETLPRYDMALVSGDCSYIWPFMRKVSERSPWHYIVYE
jgi:hypothetical protein